MAIDLMGSDPWGAVGSGGGSDPISDLLGGASVAALDPTGGFLSLGLKLLSGGKTDKSQTAGAAETLLNTSGYVVGEGDAMGGGLDSSRGAVGFAWPWWYWAAGSFVAIAIIKKVV